MLEMQVSLLEKFIMRTLLSAQSDGQTYVAYEDFGNSKKATVMKTYLMIFSISDATRVIGVSTILTLFLSH